MEKLKIIFVDYGLGVYYTYTDKDGKKHPCIQMNVNMLKFDVDLFCWVFNHELDHYKFYQIPENTGKKNNMADEVKRLLTNPKMFMKLNKFERTYEDVYKKGFEVLKDNGQVR